MIVHQVILRSQQKTVHYRTYYNSIVGMKKHRMTIGLDKADLDFLQGLGIFKNNSDGIRFAIKLMRLHSIPAIKAIKQDLIY
jgi:hypothetical protein